MRKRDISVITAVGIGRLVQSQIVGIGGVRIGERSEVPRSFAFDLMGQMFSRLSDWVRRRHNLPVEEPVPLDAQEFRGLSNAEEDSEEDPEEVVIEDTKEDPEEDSMGTDDYVPRGYTPELRDPEDFVPWDEFASD
ncbi:hypothetical protein FNV43_RR00528 [Rhamnella rubrinervis]|uniref:Uncharacterized protein n=1 Tax=Rhamnella rubrinervis TaxID=2594499 RepID=A0A8K0MR93_9ROSA|nr:hypothetical protein FNV43_RR00528 [Rhamnella rubrinervis]